VLNWSFKVTLGILILFWLQLWLQLRLAAHSAASRGPVGVGGRYPHSASPIRSAACLVSSAVTWV